MKAKIQALKGFRDFYPEDLVFRDWLFEKARLVSTRFGYQEYDGPVLENLALYEAKSGEELVKEQAYVFKDKKEQKIALRPEMTPTLARMVAQKRNQLVFPLRWFNIGRRWRYEQPQTGRFREFWQWDIDLIGETSPEADAEIIAIAAEFLKEIGLTNKEVVIKVNNRRLIDQKLDLIEIPKSQKSQVFKAIDKKDRWTSSRWQEFLKQIGLSNLQIKDLEGIINDQDYAGESEELTAIFSTLADLGVSSLVEFDPAVVRGLDYYTGTVFEARDRKGEFRAILGGGRYDNLLEAIGGEKISGIGFAAGDAVLGAVLEKYNLAPVLSPLKSKVLVTVFDESLFRTSLKIGQSLRQQTIPTEIFLNPIRLDKQLKYADRKGIPLVVIIGPEENEKGIVILKNLQTGIQEAIEPKQLIKKIKDLLE